MKSGKGRKRVCRCVQFGESSRRTAPLLSTSAAGGKRGGKGRRVWFRLCSRSRRRTPQQGAADRGGRRMAGAGAKKSHDRNGRGLELRRVWKFYTAKVGTTSIRAKAFGEKNRGRSVILRVGGVRVVCSVHRPPERVERVERAAPTHGKTNGRPYERSSRKQRNNL